MIKFNINIRSNRVNKLGLAPLYLTVNINGQQAKKQLKLAANPKEWQANTQTLKPTAQNGYLNLQIINLKQTCSKLALTYNYTLANEITAQDFINEVLCIKPKETTDRLCFYNFFQKHITNRNVSNDRLRHYMVFINQLKEFAPRLKLNQVDYNFLSSYFAYLSTINNQNNTQIYKLKIIRLTISEAYKMNLIDKMPNLKYTIKATPTNRLALTEAELNHCYNYYQNKTILPNLKETLKQFLFMCYTGLRYSDLVKFNTTMVKNNIIYLKQSKTQKVVQIPLNKWALELLPKYQFNTISNQRTNANLKCLAYLLKIDVLTCHIARHTFGTMCLNKGIGIDTVAEIMGHSNTNVTKIYAKMLPTFKVQEMAKWG